MAALEPTRKRLTAFTIESIVGRSSPSPPKSSSPLSSHHVDDSRPQDQRSSPRKPAPNSGSVSTSLTSVAAVVPGATSAGRHLELLARFATPNLTGSPGSLPTSAILGGGNTGVVTLAEALLRAGGHLPYATVELVNRGNGFTGPAATPRLRGQASTLDGAAPTALTLFRGPTWTPQELSQRISAQGWSASLVHPLTTGVRPTAGHAYMHHPYAGKYHIYVLFPHLIHTQSFRCSDGVIN